MLESAKISQELANFDQKIDFSMCFVIFHFDGKSYVKFLTLALKHEDVAKMTIKVISRLNVTPECLYSK